MSNQQVLKAVKHLKPDLEFPFYLHWWIGKDFDTKQKKIYDITNCTFVNEISPRSYRSSISAKNGYKPILNIQTYKNVLSISIILVNLKRVYVDESKNKNIVRYMYYKPGYTSEFSTSQFPITRLFVVDGGDGVYDIDGNEIENIFCMKSGKFVNENVYNYIKRLFGYYNVNYQESLNALISWNNNEDHYKIGNESIPIRPWDIDKFLRSKFKNISISAKMQKDLFQIPLEEVDADKFNHYGNNVVCKIEDCQDMTIIRCFYNTYEFAKNNRRMKENRRFYIPFDCKKSITGYQKSSWSGQWGKLCFGNEFRGTENAIFIGQTQNKRVNYILNGITDNMQTRLGSFIAAMKYPFIEKAIKLGYVNVVNILTQHGSIKTTLNKKFGGTVSSNVYKAFNLNKYQLKTLNDNLGGMHYANCYDDFVDLLKQLLGENYLHADEKTSTIAVNILYHMYHVASYRYNTGFDAFIPSNIPENKKANFLFRIEHLYQKDNEIYRYLKDAISMTNWNVPEGTMIPEFDYEHNFDSNYVLHWHNNVTDVVARARERIREMTEMEFRDKFEKNKEKRRWIEYEDEDYVIKLPDKYGDLQKEGTALHHCVGGYETEHAIGNTTILFLRSKKEIDTPLATIEVKNKVVQQIHLMYNAWLGTRPELIPTVMRWMRDKEIKCSDEILLSTAKGYARGDATLIEKPQI